NFPLISTKHGAGQTSAAGTLWRQHAITSTAVLAIGILAVWAVLKLLTMNQLMIAERFISPYQVAILAVGCLASHLLSIQGMYYLAKWRKPLARAAVCGFLITAAMVWTGGMMAGINGVIIGYTLGMAGITLPLHTLDYLMHRRYASPTETTVHSGGRP